MVIHHLKIKAEKITFNNRESIEIICISFVTQLADTVTKNTTKKNQKNFRYLQFKEHLLFNHCMYKRK